MRGGPEGTLKKLGSHMGVVGRGKSGSERESGTHQRNAICHGGCISTRQPDSDCLLLLSVLF